jgi:trehalose/maltose hydrolase-like predicted phosphorylase
MEIFQSTIENKWVKINKIEVTETEQELLRSTNEEDKVAKLELMQTIKSKRYTNLTATKSKEFVDLYNKAKPVLKETDNYQLISMDVSKTDKLSGILNCRINGEHKQVRF